MPAANSVTVGMPVYNDPSGLLRSVPTVLNQTWKGDIRLLIVDDGSTDDTAEVIESLQGVYPGIEVISNERNRGRPFVRNQILDHAETEYLAWLDAGDLWHPRKLEVQFETLSRQDDEHDVPLLCTTAFRWVFSDRGQDRIRVPDVSGDQLHAALSSKLPPYLWTLLGRTEAYRSAGRFDERLPRRQDYEFFVRFIEGGGRVVSAPPDLALATYLKSDIGRSADEVARSNQVIRQIHRPLYRRYGGGFTRQMRRRQSVLVARFHANNGNRLAAAAHTVVGWLWSPSLPSLGGIRRVVRRWGRQGVAWGARTLLRMARPLLPLARRLGLTPLLRKMVTPQGMLPAYYRELQRFSAPPSQVAEKIEASITADGDVTDVATWVRLEQAHRQAGHLDSAHSALERGLSQHPGHGELQSRLVELLALRGKWAECVEAWRSLSESQRTHATPTTYNRAAWAYREMGDAEESVRVAEAGLDRWPEDPWLLSQLYKARARRTDWATAVEAGTPLPSSMKTLAGQVSRLGFLSGEHHPIQGWLAPDESRETTVRLMMNDFEVTSTGAAPGEDGNLRFSFNCTELLEYLGDGDVIRFETSRGTLPIQDLGDSCVLRPGYPSRTEELRAKLGKGYVFENLGKLTVGNTPERKKATLALYDRVRKLVSNTEGYQLYPIYGNLLGAIRENDFITHDVGGFDVTYVSSHSRADSVREEYASICRALADSGFHLKLKPWSAYVRPQRGSDIFVDLNFAWFNAEGELNLSYGWRHQPVTDRTRFEFPREAPIGSHWVAVPGNAEEVLTQIYGSTWITPDQGYVPEVEMKRDLDSLLTTGELEAIRAAHPDQVEIAPENAED